MQPQIGSETDSIRHSALEPSEISHGTQQTLVLCDIVKKVSGHCRANKNNAKKQDTSKQQI